MLKVLIQLLIQRTGSQKFIFASFINLNLDILVFFHRTLLDIYRKYTENGQVLLVRYSPDSF